MLSSFWTYTMDTEESVKMILHLLALRHRHLRPSLLRLREIISPSTGSLRRGLAAAAMLAAVVGAPAEGAVFVVNTTLDGPDGIPGDGICDTSPVLPPSGICTLKAAVDEANLTGALDEIRFAVGGGGPQNLEVSGPNAIEVTAPLIIGGETQGGFAGVPLIHLEFSGGGAIPGLFLTGNDISVRWLRISGFPLDGIGVSGDRIRVDGCWIGLDETGAASANFRGIGVSGSDNVFGELARNVVSGNFDGGIRFGPDAARNTVVGSYLGTDPTGMVAIGNGVIGQGLKVEGDENLVRDNVISGNESIGVWLLGDGNAVLGNYIGLASDGSTLLGNRLAGVFVSEGANDNEVGGFDGLGVPTGNLISGNRADDFGSGGSGVLVAGASGTKILANRIGTDVSGQLSRGNTLHGVHILPGGTTPSMATVVGDLAPGFTGGNLISSNGTGLEPGHGILVEGSDGTRISSNRIGLSRNGSLELPNSGDGVRLVNSSESLVGGYSQFTNGGNLIAHNLGTGVAVLDPDSGAGGQNTLNNAILANSIWNNGGLAIDLAVAASAPDGVTANDPDDPDFGPNRLQNFPLITHVATNGAGLTTLSGTLNATPSTVFFIEVFDNTSCDPSGHGETRFLLDIEQITTDASGDATFSAQTMSAVTFPTATATRESVSELPTDTSEVSPCFLGVAAAGLIGDLVWYDNDEDGLQGLSEPGRPGTTVLLLNAGGTTVATTVTDADGRYRFAGVASGTYRLEFELPMGFEFTARDAGDDDSDSDADILGRTDLFAYTAGTVDLSRDAGVLARLFGNGFESGDTSLWSSTVP